MEPSKILTIRYFVLMSVSKNSPTVFLKKTAPFEKARRQLLWMVPGNGPTIGFQWHQTTLNPPWKILKSTCQHTNVSTLKNKSKWHLQRSCVGRQVIQWWERGQTGATKIYSIIHEDTMAFIGTLRLSFSAHSKNQNGQKNGDHSGGSLRQELVCDLAVYRAAS